MVGASKILTVSYGTFSCTLEGFDEPFNTMKAIAEYFRDLAADDRYFGAEPPTPDAAMLHRIAERELHRRVEARIEDNAVILRAGDPVVAARDTAAPTYATPVASAPTESAIAPHGLLAEESVAAKLQRIRAAMSRAAAAAPVAAPVIADAMLVEDDEPPAVLPVIPERGFIGTSPDAAGTTEDKAGTSQFEMPGPAPQPAVPHAANDTAEPSAATEDDTAFVTPEDLSDLAALDGAGAASEVGPAAISPAAREDDFAEEAALIARLEAARPDPDHAVPAVEVPEVEVTTVAVPAVEVPPTQSDDDTVLGDLLASLAAVTDGGVADDATDAGATDLSWQDLPEENTAEPDEASVWTDELAAAFAADAGQTAHPVEADDIATPRWSDDLGDDADSALTADDAEEDAPTHGLAAELPPAEEDTLEGLLSLDDALMQTAEADEPAGASAAYAPLTLTEADRARDRDAPDADDAADLPEDDTVSPAAEKLRRARARVIKVRRADADMLPEETFDDAAALSPQAEDDLQRELAAVEQDAEANRRAEREGRNILEANAKGDEDVTRLLRQTNTEMDGPENRRRMSTLAHLKAAVAATVAELRSPGAPSENGEASRLDRYRADLARVVRPRRPGDDAPPDRPAPLVLVSEQRIDRPAAAATDPSPARVMPRRVRVGNLAIEAPEEDPDDSFAEDEENIFGSSKNFIEFAERLGANELPDLLEAAAAYTACVEGRPHFSRPHLMRHVAAATEDSDMAREDSMRSFGQLLRQGKIEKVKRGQFAITDSSYFLAEARRMTR